MNNFIEIKENVLSDEQCFNLIDIYRFFEELPKNTFTVPLPGENEFPVFGDIEHFSPLHGGTGFAGNVNHSIKNSLDIELLRFYTHFGKVLNDIRPYTPEDLFTILPNISNVLTILQEEALLYRGKYSLLENLTISALQLQYYPPNGGGYFATHYERSSTLNCIGRELTYIIYLNSIDQEDGGYTEFPDYGIKVQPEAGKLIIFPAGFTHRHVGSLCSKSKYILTGWVEGLTEEQIIKMVSD